MHKQDHALEKKWNRLLLLLESRVGKKPSDLNAVLFLIGLQELGKGPANFSKEQKQDVLHIATCKVLSLSGFYALEGHDEDGWPHWKLMKKLPALDLLDQEKLLKMHIIEYFTTEIWPEETLAD